MWSLAKTNSPRMTDVHPTEEITNLKARVTRTILVTHESTNPFHRKKYQLCGEHERTRTTNPSHRNTAVLSHKLDWMRTHHQPFPQKHSCRFPTGKKPSQPKDLRTIRLVDRVDFETCVFWDEPCFRCRRQVNIVDILGGRVIGGRRVGGSRMGVLYTQCASCFEVLPTISTFARRFFWISSSRDCLRRSRDSFRRS